MVPTSLSRLRLQDSICSRASFLLWPSLGIGVIGVVRYSLDVVCLRLDFDCEELAPVKGQVNLLAITEAQEYGIACRSVITEEGWQWLATHVAFPLLSEPASARDVEVALISAGFIQTRTCFMRNVDLRDLTSSSVYFQLHIAALTRAFL